MKMPTESILVSLVAAAAVSGVVALGDGFFSPAWKIPGKNVTAPRSAATPRTPTDRLGDSAIRMEVWARLLNDARVDGALIAVDSRDGVVYLTGSVRSAEEKVRAAELARNTQHVRNVVTKLSIEKS